MKRFLLLFAIVCQLLACDDSVITDQPSKLVLEGWVDDGGFPVVIVTRTLPISNQEAEVNNLEDYLVRWAKVTVSDGSRTVVLTGKYDNKYFPPYIYTTGNLRGEAGKTYTLTVEYEGEVATAVTTIPKPVPIVSCRQEQYQDSLYHISISFDDPESEKNYYQVFTKVGEDSRLYCASNMGTIDDDAITGRCDVPVFRGHGYSTKYQPYFRKWEEVTVKLATIDRESFSFWDSYVKNTTLQGSVFTSTSMNIRSNVEGGYGYWTGMGASYAYIIVGK